MNEDRKPGYKSILTNKKALIVAAAAIAMTFTLTASAFVDDNTSAKKYEKNQAMSGANACGDGELPLNVLCNNEASEIQGDENAIGMTSAQEGGAIEQPYENLVDEVSMQSALNDEKNQISEARMSSVLDSSSSDLSNR
ncbi:MAG: hypothetical protein ACRD5J_04695 [Nitrososphaeraceae archaeon]